MKEHLKPSYQAEEALVNGIMDGRFPPGSNLPGERELAGMLGVTRPTLRETLSRLDRDGWVSIRHGKATRVNDYRNSGGLNVLSAMVRFRKAFPPEFIGNLLEVRMILAPHYTRAALACDPQRILDFLATAEDLPEDPEHFMRYDWDLHHLLTVVSGNPVFTWIINGFSGLYQYIGIRYFQISDTRAASRLYYQGLSNLIGAGELDAAQKLTADVMYESLKFWNMMSQELDGVQK